MVVDQVASGAVSVEAQLKATSDKTGAHSGMPSKCLHVAGHGAITVMDAGAEVWWMGGGGGGEKPYQCGLSVVKKPTLASALFDECRDDQTSSMTAACLVLLARLSHDTAYRAQGRGGGGWVCKHQATARV